jgi:DNA polymerase-3 subunit beta
MKIIVERDALADALGTAKHSTDRTATIPILKNARLDVTPNRLSIAATNMDMRIELTIPAEVVDDDGVNAITVPVVLLSEIVTRLPKGAQVTLKWEAQTTSVTLSSGRASYKLHALNADMFPILVAPNVEPIRFSLPGKKLAAALNLVRWTTSDNPDQSFLHGVNVHLGSNAHISLGGAKDKKLILIATDGYQVARTMIDLPPGLSSLPNITVPNAALSEIARLANETNGDIDIAVSETMLSVTTPKASFLTKMIDGQFPDCQRFFPEETTSLRVDVEMLRTALLRLKALGSGNRTRADIRSDTLTLSVTNNEAGQAEEIVAIEYEGEPVERSLSAGGILSVLEHMDADVALFRLGGIAKPIMVNPTIGDMVDYSRTFLTMPMEGKQ